MTGFRVVLTVSPVPLVATATGQHVLIANTYSKSVLRAAATEIAQFSCCELEGVPNLGSADVADSPSPACLHDQPASAPRQIDFDRQLSALVAEAHCEEAAAGLQGWGP